MREGLITIILLAILGVIEAVVWLWRMRTAVGASRLTSALATGAVTTTRILFVLLGASAVIAREPWPLAIAAYVIPSTLATYLMPHKPSTK